MFTIMVLQAIIITHVCTMEWIFTAAHIFIVDKDWAHGGVDVEVVVVVAGNGEIPHPAVALGRDPAAQDGSGITAGRGA
jgi:hypothetical protein